ncbi:hypothetical protein ASG01_04670 [Chryseobacterium sp. Leaf180]|uniref:rhomboid family intramembrane serine protease n=1 Tax=Chryseobacterium sp. Leaf180 TaxID=1736289 RepID=UPI0006F47FB9|nr:rhomboid family intramembrane serine protease [Chryseobacterium sp. Leaf180]KQR95150.1 hypothetical protein ASG01_04670 [Chryseobacterium sp. Leaf180]
MFNSIPPITRNLIIINVVVYIISNFIFKDLYSLLSGYFPLSPYFKSFQIITHMFMHAELGNGIGIAHILFNMFTLYSFGPILEHSLGEKKFLILYFVCGLGAYTLFNLWNYFEYQQLYTLFENLGLDVVQYMRNSDQYIISPNKITTQEMADNVGKLFVLKAGTMVGASGAIFGVIAAFATLYPESKIGIMFIPVPVKVKILLPIIIVGSIYLGITGSGGNVAHLAHVGGAIVGFILAMIWRKHLYRFN